MQHYYNLYVYIYIHDVKSVSEILRHAHLTLLRDLGFLTAAFTPSPSPSSLENEKIK